MWRRLAPPHHAADTGFDGPQEAFLVEPRDEQHDPLDASPAQKPDRASRFRIDLVGDDERDRIAFADMAVIDEPDPSRLAELRHRPGARERVGGQDENVDPRWYGLAECLHLGCPLRMPLTPSDEAGR